MLEVLGGVTYRQGDHFTLYLAAGPRWHDYKMLTEIPTEKDEFRDAGNLSYSVRLKLCRTLGKGIDLLGHARYEKVDVSGVGFHDDVREYNRDRVQKTFGGGVGVRYYKADTFDLTAGILFFRQRLNDVTDFVESTQYAPTSWQNVKSTTRVLPQMFVAFEVNLKSWFVLRTGVAQTVREVEEYTEEQLTDVVFGEDRQEVSSTIDTNIGVRFLYKSLFVDFWLHSSAPYAPSAFIAGTGLTNPVMEVSTGYAF
jgi:hypothetical protein